MIGCRGPVGSNVAEMHQSISHVLCYMIYFPTNRVTVLERRIRGGRARGQIVESRQVGQSIKPACLLQVCCTQYFVCGGRHLRPPPRHISEFARSPALAPSRRDGVM